MNTHHTYDTIVIGGGPAGSTVATLVAEQGRRVLLLEREAEPKFKIGESLIPATYWTFKRLGMLEKLRTSHFPQKYSVQFYSRSGKASTPVLLLSNQSTRKCCYMAGPTERVRRDALGQCERKRGRNPEGTRCP